MKGAIVFVLVLFCTGTVYAEKGRIYTEKLDEIEYYFINTEIDDIAFALFSPFMAGLSGSERMQQIADDHLHMLTRHPLRELAGLPSKGEKRSRLSVLDRLTFKALHCQRFKDEGLPLQAIRAQIDRGGYYLTHVYLVLNLYARNGCINMFSPQIANLLEYMQPGIRSMELLDDRAETDLWLEALVFRCFLMDCGGVNHHNFKRLIQLQNKDFGWGYREGDSSNLHTTGLAYMFIAILRDDKKHIRILQTPVKADDY